MFGDLVLLVVILAALLAIVIVGRVVWGRERCWRSEDHLRGDDLVQVRCVKRGEPPINIGGPLDINAPDFEYEIEERRNVACAKLAALNSGTRRR